MYIIKNGPCVLSSYLYSISFQKHFVDNMLRFKVIHKMPRYILEPLGVQMILFYVARW